VLGPYSFKPFIRLIPLLANKKMCDQPEERPLSKVLTTCDDLELTKAVEEIKSNIPWKQYFTKRI
jgi:hypothetical protein